MSMELKYLKKKLQSNVCIVSLKIKVKIFVEKLWLFVCATCGCVAAAATVPAVEQ